MAQLPYTSLSKGTMSGNDGSLMDTAETFSTILNNRSHFSSDKTQSHINNYLKYAKKKNPP